MSKHSTSPHSVEFSIGTMDVVKFEFNKNQVFNYDQDKNKLVYELSGDINIEVKKDKLNVMFDYILFIDKKKKENLLFEFQFSNYFSVDKIKSLFEPSENLNQNSFIKYLISLSISHARGAFSVMAKKTSFDKISIPFLDADQVNTKFVD